MKKIVFLTGKYLLILTTFWLLPDFIYAADIYKCTDNNGKITFSDKKCAENAEVISNAEIQVNDKATTQGQSTYDSVSVTQNDDAALSRWLPRLRDPSGDVREEAAENISKIASNNPATRDKLIPILIAHCRTEESWPVVTNGIFYPLGNLSTDPKWREQFLDLYILLADKNDYVTGGKGYEKIWNLIEKGLLDTQHPRFQTILGLANKGKGAKYPPDSNVSDLRLYSMKILDWYADAPKN